MTQDPQNHVALDLAQQLVEKYDEEKARKKNIQ